MTTLACWVVAASLMAHLVVWAVLAFTDLRWTTVEAPATEVPVVVKVEEPARATARRASPLDAPRETPAPSAAVDVNRVPSAVDAILAQVTLASTAAGRIAMVVVLPLIGLGVVLAITTSTEGVENAVSAFTWSIVVSLLVLPVDAFLGAGDGGGALADYGRISALAERGLTLDGVARLALLPAASIVGVALVALRFSTGVAAGLMQRENLRLDLALESEAANVKPGSLHASRAAAAFDRAAAAHSTAPVAPPAAPTTKIPVPSAAPTTKIPVPAAAPAAPTGPAPAPAPAARPGTIPMRTSGSTPASRPSAAAPPPPAATAPAPERTPGPAIAAEPDPPPPPRII